MDQSELLRKGRNQMNTTRAEREAIFGSIYTNHTWGGISVSGTGSDMGQTQAIRAKLPPLLKRMGFKSMLDIPCGDLHWMSRMLMPTDLQYVGADIVPELIEKNRQQFRFDKTVSFQVLDILVDTLPSVDLIFARDLFGHFSNADVETALFNIKKSGATHLFATSFPDVKKNKDIETGGWRPINMALFGLEPIQVLDEELFNEKGENVGKTLTLYKLK